MIVLSNRLQHETSPCLIQHAENPVDDRSGGEEAFRKAREEDEPVFRTERPISRAYQALDNDLARDNMENDLPDSDLQDL